jgi:flagellar biogenesis protein FliO
MTMMEAVARTVFPRFTNANPTTVEKWIVQKRTQQLATRRLRVAETVSLGEKRFVSIVQVDGTQFLVGGAAGSVSLLAVLEGAQEKPCAATHRAQAEKDRC